MDYLKQVREKHGYLVASVLEWAAEQVKKGREFKSPSDLVHQYYLELLPPCDLAESHEMQAGLVASIKALVKEVEGEGR